MCIVFRFVEDTMMILVYGCEFPLMFAFLSAGKVDQFQQYTGNAGSLSQGNISSPVAVREIEKQTRKHNKLEENRSFCEYNQEEITRQVKVFYYISTFLQFVTYQGMAVK